MSLKPLVIAIDGPAASGKSTTARRVAERLGYVHLDTGAMYRAVALKVDRLGIDPEDRAGISLLMETTAVSVRVSEVGQRVLLDGEDVTDHLRSPGVTAIVSAVSSIPSVRTAMVREQQRLGKNGGVVLEGRDIGTVVFPSADVKIFMVADLDSRARRRQKEFEESGVTRTAGQIRKELEDRDRYDSTRDASPLVKANDAIEVDTSYMTIDEQVTMIVDAVRRIQEGHG